MARTVTSRQLRNDLARYIKEAEGGEEIIVTNRGRAVARLVPPQRAPLPKRLGALEGLLTIPDDFDEPCVEIIEAMEGADGEQE
jgi:prevent-host-death family protein